MQQSQARVRIRGLALAAAAGADPCRICVKLLTLDTTPRTLSSEGARSIPGPAGGLAAGPALPHQCFAVSGGDQL